MPSNARLATRPQGRSLQSTRRVADASHARLGSDTPAEAIVPCRIRDCGACSTLGMNHQRATPPSAVLSHKSPRPSSKLRSEPTGASFSIHHIPDFSIVETATGNHVLADLVDVGVDQIHFARAYFGMGRVDKFSENYITRHILCELVRTFCGPAQRAMLFTMLFTQLPGTRNQTDTSARCEGRLSYRFPPRCWLVRG